MNPRRGEVWWVQLDPVVGSEIRKKRPCVVMGGNVLNERRRTVVVIPLSSAPLPAPPLTVPVVCRGRDAVAVIDQIRAVAKERFGDRIGELSKQELEDVEEALCHVLEL